MAGYVWLTYRELADRLGISPDGARMKARRRKWTATTDNAGSIRVSVPEAELVGGRTNVRPRTHSERSAEQPNAIKAFEALVETLRERLVKADADVAHHRAEVERARLEADRWRQDAEQERQHARSRSDQIKHLADAHAAAVEARARLEMDIAGVRSDLERERTRLEELQAEAQHQAAENERLRAELARPWWRRLIGR
jgi:chromosome segregation ATPase